MAKTNVGILNLGGGNIASVANAIGSRACRCYELLDTRVPSNVEVLVLPGVGSARKFSEALSHTNASDVWNFVNSGKKVVGICLGMQMLFERTHETFPASDGMKLFEGVADRLCSRPFHIGWNSVKFIDDRFKPFDNQHFFFNHGYRVFPEYDDCVVGYANVSHMELLPSVVARGNIFGLQFHPEKSQKVGKDLLNKIILEF